MTTNEIIMARMKLHNTLLCCGLDPVLDKIPKDITRHQISDEEKIFEFLKSVIDITASHVCSYKAQKAFFDVLPDGYKLLKRVVNYVHSNHKNIPVIVDCKVGDIANTMQAYTQSIFETIDADGIVANPYMGDDAILSLTKFVDKSVAILVKTSNRSGGVVQDVILQNGEPFWQHILKLVVNEWGKNKNVIPILSSNIERDAEKVRLIIPENTPILLAGIGTQGGNCEVLKHMLNSEGIGVIVNSSRSILYPPKNHLNWQSSIESATASLKKMLNDKRKINE